MLSSSSTKGIPRPPADTGALSPYLRRVRVRTSARVTLRVGHSKAQLLVADGGFLSSSIKMTSGPQASPRSLRRASAPPTGARLHG